MTSIKMTHIQANAITFDAEQLHNYIISKVNNGEYETCLEALSDYAEQNDLDMSNINKLISPVLRCILYKEASEKNLLSDNQNSFNLDTLFI